MFSEVSIKRCGHLSTVLTSSGLLLHFHSQIEEKSLSAICSQTYTNAAYRECVSEKCHLRALFIMIRQQWMRWPDKLKYDGIGFEYKNHLAMFFIHSHFIINGKDPNTDEFRTRFQSQTEAIIQRNFSEHAEIQMLIFQAIALKRSPSFKFPLLILRIILQCKKKEKNLT